MTTYNKHTGRPIRKSAGKIKKLEGYIDLPTSECEEDDDDEDDDDNNEDGDEDDYDDKIGRRGRAIKQNKARLKKRKRGPSPPSPFLNPIIYEEELDEMTDLEKEGTFRHAATRRPSQQTTLQFNVPLGFHGPLFVKLDSTFMESNKDALHEMKPRKPKKARTVHVQSTSTVRYRGFTDLPPELRNTIYRHLFARKNQDDILKIPVTRHGSSGALSRSGQFLRTCRLVYSEGCSVLYGENTFSFHRHYATRCTFWEAVPKEIGYQDVLHFLKMIGPENLQYLRDVKWSFDDAYPRDTPYLSCSEERRYLNDEYLISCLRILRNAKLRKITLFFDGRRQLQCTDFRFLNYLEQIKADEVVQSTDRFYSYRDKAHPLAWSEIKAAMTRKKKLYSKE